METYRYVISKKIVKNPMRIINKIIVSCSKEKSFLHNFIEVSSIDDVLNALENNNCGYLELVSVSELDFQRIIKLTSNYVECIHLIDCHFDLEVLNSCGELKVVEILYNQKIEKLWNLCNNRKLDKLVINGCENLKDIRGIRDSLLQELEIKKGFSTIPDVLGIQIPDFNLFSSLTNLKKLTLFVSENKDKAKDLVALSKLTQLESLFLPREYFTFEEFAWLKSRLIDTKGIDCIYYLAKDPANEKVVAMIIGKGQPSWLYDDGSDYQEYHNKYTELIKTSQS